MLNQFDVKPLWYASANKILFEMVIKLYKEKKMNSSKQKKFSHAFLALILGVTKNCTKHVSTFCGPLGWAGGLWP
jgi:hypothetical protein